LPQVRCPRCGTTNDTRRPGYPFCIGCQDNLARCGYCRFFDSGSVICTQPLVAGVFEVSAEATPPCGYHAAKDAIQVRRWGLGVLVWVGLAAALFALGFGLRELFRPQPLVLPAAEPGVPAPELQLAVEADYRGATVGQPYTVDIVLHNTSEFVVDQVRLKIARESLGVLYLDPTKVRPRPQTDRESGEWRVLGYPELNPWERRRIALEFVPREAGALHLKVRLFSGKDTYHGQSILPITVEEPPPNGSGEEEEQ
jgi:hypothetical protein